MIDYLKEYAASGWYVFPVNPENKRPYLPGSWLEYATTDVEQIKTWWTVSPSAMVALRCGEKSGVFVVDCDAHTEEENGIENFLSLWREHESTEEPDTLSQSSPSGGRHYFFATPSDGRKIKNSAGTLAPAVDVRGENGYIVLSPSVTAQGRAYAWRNQNTLKTAPEWLITLCTKKEYEAPKQGTPIKPFSGDILPYAKAALEDELERVRRAVVGERNHTLNRAAFSCGQLVGGGALPLSLVQQELERAAESSGLTRTDGQHAVLKTIMSGLKAGMAQPRAVPENTYQSREINPVQVNKQEVEKMSVKPLSEELESLIDAFLVEPEPQTTGFKGLDNILKGGFPASGMFVIGAAPATGKSALALALAANRAKNGGNALFFSCEMDKFELTTRLFSSASELDQDTIEKKLRDGDRAAIPGFDKVVREILPRLSIVDLEGNPSIEIIEKTAEHFAQTKEKPLVIVDYLQLIKLSSAKDNQDTLFRLSEVAKRLKTLSKQCPIIVISSLNREGYKGKSGEADLTAFKASGDIEFSANWAAILEETPETREENGEKSLTLRVVKARRWRNKAEAYFKYKGACYKFTDAGSDDYRPALKSYQQEKQWKAVESKF